MSSRVTREPPRCEVTTLRYEREHGGTVERLDRAWTLHWYPRDVLARLIAGAGLAIDSVSRADRTPAPDTATDVDLVLRHA